ncbi:MAG: hypothetical protein K1X85_07340 [Ignavibacteria bacterium]|nr:hypothetical protein [Ignavibacteria bacterium]
MQNKVPFTYRKADFGFYTFLVALSLIALLSFAFYSPSDIQDDVNNKFTTVGNITLTVTNYGTIGNGFVNFPNQPSCQYPKNSGIEHLFVGGLWIGGSKNNEIKVTTAAVDVSNANRTEGFEFTNAAGTGILERSTLQNSPNFRPDAISHQDFVCDFFDTNTSVNGTVIQNHNPLGVKVLLQTYCYDYNFANNWVILNYKILNIGYRGNTDPIDSIFIGLWSDAVVRNTNITVPGGTSFYNKGADGYIDTLRMAYEYDYNGDPGFTNSYIGFKLLGTSPTLPNEDIGDKTYFTIWQFRNNTDPVYLSPQTDEKKFVRLNGYLENGQRIDTNQINQLRQTPNNRSVLLSYGPYRRTDGSVMSLNYLQDTINIVYAVICAKKNGTDPATLDTDFQKQNLYTAAGWAQSAYDNGYKLPSPPDDPKVRTVLEDKNVTIFWAANSESSVDPISNLQDFEGYRIYRTNPGADLNLEQDLTTQLRIVGEFDSAYNNVSNNTGFNFIKLQSPKYFENDTAAYYYRFDFPNQLNGFQYVYSVTAFDKGDVTQNLGSLESSILGNSQRIIVGTPPNNSADAEVGVYPNPYYGSAVWDGSGNKKELLRKIYFYNLPSQCEISIWTLAGDLVDRFNHDASTYNGSDIEWFNTYSDGTQKFAGGEHAWDMISQNDQAIASGLYIFTVKDSNSGEIKKGKFVVVK